MRPTVTLFEGLDRSGKSTLAEAVGRAIGVPVFKKSVPPSLRPDQRHLFFRGTAWCLLDVIAQRQSSLLVDRSFVSDFVYDHGGDSADRAPWSEWESQALLVANVLLVYVVCDPSTIVNRLNVRPDRYLSPELIGRHLAAYDDYFSHTSIRVVRVSGQGDLKTSKAQVIHAIMRAE